MTRVNSAIGRRKFLSKVTMSTAGMMLAPVIAAKEDPKRNSSDLMNEVMRYRKIDSHMHVLLSSAATPEVQIDFADRLGIEKLIVSRPVTKQEAPHQEFRDSNDILIKTVKQYPDRFIAQFTLHPKYTKESIEEIKRCVDHGMIGLKVYYQVKINDPLFYPIIEKMIDHKMIILMHAFCQLGIGGYRMKYDTKLYPNTSLAEDFVDVAQRYPEAMFQFAHITGGGDWQYECKVLKDYPNIYVDVSGSNNEADAINYALKYLGEDRIFFGSDNCYYQAVSKVLAADLTETRRKKIFFENYNNMLRKGGYNVD